MNGRDRGRLFIRMPLLCFCCYINFPIFFDSYLNELQIEIETYMMYKPISKLMYVIKSRLTTSKIKFIFVELISRRLIFQIFLLLLLKLKLAQQG